MRFSDHARKRMIERGISADEAGEIITKGRKWREGGKLHAKMHGIEVVYVVENSDYFVVTVYYG